MTNNLQQLVRLSEFKLYGISNRKCNLPECFEISFNGNKDISKVETH